jgi:spore photoproduct lyase
MKFPIDQIWIDEDAVDESLTKEIIRRAGTPQVLVGQQALKARQAIKLASDPFKPGKRALRLMKNKGAFVKPCPGTPQYVCCGLEILHIGQGCPMDCRYCALQAYFNRPVMEVFVNTNDLWESLKCHLQEQPHTFHRICTGEFTDSLALDPLTDIAGKLVQFFGDQKNASLEIKTKTNMIDSLMKFDPRGKTILSFSMNAREIVAREERSAASLKERLSAAAMAQSHGYLLGFHFDPIIPMAGWENSYSETIDTIFQTVNATSIAWISLGVLRFVPDLKDIVMTRFGPVTYFHDGFLRGLDGKSRLSASRRIAIYQKLADRIRNHAADACIYLCMESPYVWEEALDVRMNSDEELSRFLEHAVTSRPIFQAQSE